METLARQKRRIAYFFPVLMGILGIVLVAIASLPFAGEAGESSDSMVKKDELGSSVAPTAGPSLSLMDGAILGIIEGVTEYLPVSSTGHLLLAEHILGLADDPETKRAANAYAIVIQAGAILAVLGLYRNRIRQMLLGLMGRDAGGRRLAINLVIAFLPAGVAALLLGDLIKSRLFGLWPVTAAWFVGGIALFVLDRKRPHDAPGLALEDFGWRHALGIGLMQCVALWPGVSRSLATIAGGLLMGASMGAAVEFSFLLGLITLGAATVYEAYKSGNMIIASFGLMAPLLGFFCALISAWVSIKWMVSFLQRRGLSLFGWYRIVLALLVATVMVIGDR